MAISSQLTSLTRWAVAFIVIYMVLPIYIVPVSGDTILERFFSRYVRMVALTIVLGYILVALKLYELLSLVFVFLVIIVLLKIPAKYRKYALREIGASFALWIYDVLDGLIHPYQLFRQWLIQRFLKVKTEIVKFTNLTNSLQAVLLIAVLAYSAYLRFYDALHHAAPAMSDAYVTLAWMKYIDGRMLFHDGIYPQGFHIYLSILHKFAACDALFILKYTGPLNGVLTTLGLYLFVSKITGRKLPGVISALVFGVFGGILPLEWHRQGSTNSQEFAIVFLFPAWYYAVSFLKTRNKEYLWTAAAAFAVIGFVHTLILAYLCLGLACIVSAYLLLDFRKTLRSVGQLFVTGIFAGVVAALPVPIALLFGKTFHNSSIEYLAQQVQSNIQVIPIITFIDKIALLGLVLFFLITLWKRKSGYDQAESLFIFCLGVSAFFLYLLVGPISENALLIGRLGILWSLLAACGVGLGLEAVFRMIWVKSNTLKLSLSAIVSIFLITGAIVYFKPAPTQQLIHNSPKSLSQGVVSFFRPYSTQLSSDNTPKSIIQGAIEYFRPVPAKPYKMQYDAEVDQYLRISEEFPNSTWTFVSVGDEGYDLVLGKGLNINAKDFLIYDPQNSKLVKMVDGKLSILADENLFILIQKKLFLVDQPEMVPILAQREKDYAELEQWVAKYKESHDNLSVYYQDDNIVIYHIHQPKSKADSFQEIWGQSIKEK